MPSIGSHSEQFPIVGWVAYFQHIPQDARRVLPRPIERAFADEISARAWLAEVRRTTAPNVEIASCVVPVRRERCRT